MTQSFVGTAWRVGMDSDHDFTPPEALKAAVEEYAASLPQPLGVDYNYQNKPLGAVTKAEFVDDRMEVTVSVEDDMWAVLQDWMSDDEGRSIDKSRWIGDRLRPSFFYRQDTKPKSEAFRRLDRFTIAAVEACLNLEPITLPKPPVVLNDLQIMAVNVVPVENIVLDISYLELPTDFPTETTPEYLVDYNMSVESQMWLGWHDGND